MSRPRIDGRTGRLIVGAAMAAALTAACTSSSTGTRPPNRIAASAASSTVSAGDTRVDDAQCAMDPPAGRLTQALGGVSFRSGRILVKIDHLTPAPAPGEVADAGPDTDSGSADGCHEFPKWGNDDPVVPPDSALFVFKDPRSDGAQIEAPLAEVVSRREVTAQIGVVVRDRYFQAFSCALRLTAFDESQAAGSFTCPTAVLVQANPFSPDDNVDARDLLPESPAPASPDQAPVATAALSGWFEVSA